MREWPYLPRGIHGTGWRSPIRTTKHIGGDIHAFEVKRGEGRHGIFQLIDGWIKIICQQDPIAISLQRMIGGLRDLLFQ